MHVFTLLLHRLPTLHHEAISQCTITCEQLLLECIAIFLFFYSFEYEKAEQHIKSTTNTHAKSGANFFSTSVLNRILTVIIAALKIFI